MIENIVNKVRLAQRIDKEEALKLWQEAPLWLLAELATDIKKQKSGNKVFYNKNFHIEPTNICACRCKFCSFRRDRGEEGSWDYSLEELLRQVELRKDSGATEVHIVGGLAEDKNIDFYIELVRGIKKILPGACVKALTAAELYPIIKRSGLTIREGLLKLKENGMESIPGGGAEIFDDVLRREICPQKVTTKQWFEVHNEAHQIGIDTNATMLYGHIEKIEHRIDHMLLLREQQDKTHGFNAFIPLKFRSANNEMSALGETSISDDLRTLAMSRIILDNFNHIKAYWVMYGLSTAELALSFGADDIDGTIEDSTKIYSMAGAEEQKPVLSVEKIHEICRNAGFVTCERDTHYNILK